MGLGYNTKRGCKRKMEGDHNMETKINGPPTKRRRKNERNIDDDEDMFKYNNTSIAMEYNDDDYDNPIPEFIDIMTGNKIIKPAISPYGHVLGYDSWSKLLRTGNTKNQCPFTKQNMTRRMLVKLTLD